MKIGNFSKVAILFLLLFVFLSCNNKNTIQNSESIDVRVDNLLIKMSLSQKLSLLQGDGMSIPAIDSLGIPSLEVADGPFGAHRGGAITSFPCGTAIGATWDTLLIYELAAAIGREAKAKNINCLLGPGFNIIRHPLCGRNFEYYSEDPFLTGELAVAFTKGVQSEKVAATLKHYAANNQEFYRNSVNVIVDNRTLHEIYFPAFKAAVQRGDAWSVMSAYNQVNGVYCSENKYLLTDMLKTEWGFRGFVMPDWAGSHSTVPSVKAGLDCVIYDSELYGTELAEAVKKGEVSEEEITEMARRVLRVIFLTGSMDDKQEGAVNHTNSVEHQAINRRASRESLVLLKNANNVLPLQSDKLNKLAVIGPNAAKLRMGGGGSSYVTNVHYSISPLEGIKNRADKNTKVEYALGVSIADTLIPIQSKYLTTSAADMSEKGLKAEYFNNMHLKGKPVATQIDTTLDFIWQAGPNFYLSDYEKKEAKTNEINQSIGNDYFSIRWTGMVTPPKTGYYDFITFCDDGIRLYVDNKLIIDQWYSHDKEYRYGTLALEGGKPYKIKVEYYEEIGGAAMRLGWYYHDPKLIDEAVELAKNSDAVVLCAGIDKFWEAEGADRTDFELSMVQNILINAVAAVNPNTVVVLNNGGPLNITPWIGNVAGLIEAWFTGNEGGNAIADVLFGNYNPSGKLPYSYVQKQSDFPPAFDNYLNYNKEAVYKEGIYVGYRYHDKYGTKPLFPFGFGLSYTTFDYSNFKVHSSTATQFIVNVDIKNVGNYDGTEVVQLYVNEVNSTVDRPVKELKGFSKVFIKKGETKTIEITLNAKDLGFFNEKTNSWMVNKGQYKLMIGSSSEDIKLVNTIDVH